MMPYIVVYRTCGLHIPALDWLHEGSLRVSTLHISQRSIGYWGLPVSKVQCVPFPLLKHVHTCRTLSITLLVAMARGASATTQRQDSVLEEERTIHYAVVSTCRCTCTLCVVQCDHWHFVFYVNCMYCTCTSAIRWIGKRGGGGGAVAPPPTFWKGRA